MINVKNNVTQWSLSILIGLTFVFSAILKLVSIDSFELYIYSLQLFSYNFATIIARLIIGFEFILGFFYLLIIYRKITRITIIVVLVIFSCFLIIKYFTGSNDNCNCFGEYIKLNPLESLTKNLVLLIAILLSKNSIKFKFKYNKAVFISIIIVGIITPSIISPPDFIYNVLYAKNEESELFTSPQLSNFIEQYTLNKGKFIVCFFSLKCKYCKLAANKISVISNRVKCKKNTRYFFYGDRRDLDLFWSESKSDKLEYNFLEPNDFFRISGGRVPVIFFVDNGKLSGIYGYRTINENLVTKFLNNK